jgi:hypothetical protein
MPKRELTFLGLSEDGSSLLVADSAGTQYTIKVDGRLSATLGHPVRPGQMEIALQTLSPKDIQSRIRAGATAAEIAADSGEDVERVRRFEGPPLADREFAAEQARKCLVRSDASEFTLDGLVGARLNERGVTIESAQWDSWRREDGRWTVLVAFPAGSAERVATWVFDPESRHVTPEDDEAARMLDPTLVSNSSLRLVAEEVATATPEEIIEVVEVVDKVVVVERLAEVTSIKSEVQSEPAVAPAAPRSRAKSKTKRASVPSWDEILFGGGKDDEA